MTFDDVKVLKDGVRSRYVPHRFGYALARRQDVETLVAFGTENIPAHLQITNETVRLVLSGDCNAPNTRIHRVRKGKVDDARLAAEIYGVLGSPVRQFEKPAAPLARENKGQGLPCQRLARDGSHIFRPLRNTKLTGSHRVPALGTSTR